MLLEGLCWLVEKILNAILTVLDVLPDFPASFVEIVDEFFALIFDNLFLLSFFVRLDTIKIAIPILIVVLNFERVYRFIMWILRKIPVANIE